MKKLLIALAIMAFLFLYSCADSNSDSGNNENGTTEAQYTTVKNPITRIELSGKNNLVFK